ncbi:MAG: pyridoxine 5'-phosphate synthase [Deltaproteobacteria bacterium]|nr:MAG: pyridoxine 5'-phosphate synthase [Deltaproteobacteria bacterium]
MPHLAINVDHVATVRQARGVKEPDPVTAAAIAELAGAEGIVVHLREDRRHIQDRDVRILRQTVKTKLNLEMAATSEMQQIALEIKPDMVTLVPERRQELTTEGGLDVGLHKETLKPFIETLRAQGIAVSLFINPDLEQVKASHWVGADFVEVHTGIFSDTETMESRESEFERILDAVKLASKLGLGVNAGHGLDYRNITWFKGVKEIEEFSIGHSVVARAVIVGFERAVREMVYLVRSL